MRSDRSGGFNLNITNLKGQNLAELDLAMFGGMLYTELVVNSIYMASSELLVSY